MLDCADSINTDCVDAYHVTQGQRDPAAWLHGRLVGAQAYRQAALQTMVDTIAQEVLIPGAVVLLRTPQGEFTVTYGTTLLGATFAPRANTHFRIASNTKTMTAAVIMQLAQESKLSIERR